MKPLPQADSATARLLPAPESVVRSALHRVCALCSSGRRPDSRSALALRVDDLQGRRLGDIGDAGRLTELFLPSGTYVVTATAGEVRRSYTLTLLPGLSFDLYLSFDRLNGMQPAGK